jgi:TRAP-type C4-dicarboxylate transport system permease small subunit
MKNDEATGGIITLMFVFILSAVLFLAISYGIDRLTVLAAGTLTQSASQMRYDSLNIQLILFRLEPLILLVGAGLNYWITEARQMSGITDLSGMLVSAIEMIMGTFVLMLLCFFGGGALDMVVGTLEGWNFAPIADTYTIVQFLTPVYYSFMTLIIVSLIALFLMKCVQTVDFASTPEFMG